MSDIRPWEFDWSAIAAFIAASVALYAAWRANKIAEKNLALNAELEIIKFREQWIQKLREQMIQCIDIANVFSIKFARSEIDTVSSEVFKEITQPFRAIRLLMNPNDKYYPELVSSSLSVKQLLSKVFNQKDEGFLVLKETVQELEVEIEKLESLFQNILKLEWERLKFDIRKYENAKNK